MYKSIRALQNISQSSNYGSHFFYKVSTQQVVSLVQSRVHTVQIACLNAQREVNAGAQYYLESDCYKLVITVAKSCSHDLCTRSCAKCIIKSLFYLLLLLCIPINRKTTEQGAGKGLRSGHTVSGGILHSNTGLFDILSQHTQASLPLPLQ